MWHAATAVFKENFIALNVSIRGKNMSQLSYLSFYLKKAGKKSKLDQSKQNEGEKEDKNGE